MTTGLVQYTLNDNIAVIQMDDGKVNALSHDMLDALDTALDRAESEAEAVILVGREGRFSAGFDLKTMSQSAESATGLLKHGSKIYMRLYGLKLPLIIACSGHAIAGGALLVLCGDVRIGPEAPIKIGLNELAIGMPLPILALELARDRLHSSALTAATLGSQIYEPKAAVEAGYLDRLAPPEQLMTNAMAIAQHLSTYKREAFEQTKSRLRGKTIRFIEETLDGDLADFGGIEASS